MVLNFAKNMAHELKTTAPSQGLCLNFKKHYEKSDGHTFILNIKKSCDKKPGDTRQTNF